MVLEYQGFQQYKKSFQSQSSMSTVYSHSLWNPFMFIHFTFLSSSFVVSCPCPVHCIYTVEKLAAQNIIELKCVITLKQVHTIHKKLFQSPMRLAGRLDGQSFLLLIKSFLFGPISQTMHSIELVQPHMIFVLWIEGRVLYNLTNEVFREFSTHYHNKLRVIH